MLDAEPLPPPPPPSHLLLTEVYAQIAMFEFIEIYNPTDSAVALDDYYVSDDRIYAELASLGQPGAPTIAVSDFVARFPLGATIAAGQVIVVARDGVGFESFFPNSADYALNAPAGARAMRRIQVGADAQLSDQGEMIVLFHWDGASDLVFDVDVVLAGIPLEPNRTVDKTGVSVDGPDADAVPTVYRDDANTLQTFDDVTSDAHSYKRVRLEGHHEVSELGNGLTGHDETSEQSRSSWGQGLTFSAPTPGIVDLRADLRADLTE